MDEKTKELLLSAWHENRLAAIHIDLERMYARGNEQTFRAVGDFSGGLRAHDVQNIWITFPFLKAKERISPGVMTVEEFNRMANDPLHDTRSAMSDIVGARDNEAVVVKDWGSSFHPSSTALHDYLRELKKDTILVDGVAGHECVAKTLDDGTSLDAYTFIAVQDCINLLPDQDYEAYMRWRGVKNPSAFAKRFYTASSDMVLRTLETQKSLVSSFFKLVFPPYKTLTGLPIIGALGENKPEQETEDALASDNIMHLSSFEPMEEVESFEGYEIVSKELDQRKESAEQDNEAEAPTDVFIYTNNIPALSPLLAAAVAASQEEMALVTKDNSDPPPALTL